MSSSSDENNYSSDSDSLEKPIKQNKRASNFSEESSNDGRKRQQGKHKLQKQKGPMRFVQSDKGITFSFLKLYKEMLMRKLRVVVNIVQTADLIETMICWTMRQRKSQKDHRLQRYLLMSTHLQMLILKVNKNKCQ